MATERITVVRTVIDSTTSANATAGAPTTLFADMSPDNIFYTIMILITVIWYYMSHTLNSKKEAEAKFDREQATAWIEAWGTSYDPEEEKDEGPSRTAKLFFGLLFKTLMTENTTHPFRLANFEKVQQCYDNKNRRAAIVGLLKKGIIPLEINDGGLQTRQIVHDEGGCAVKNDFWPAWWPKYRQDKSRAYMDIAYIFDPVGESDNEDKFMAHMRENIGDLMLSCNIKDQNSPDSRGGKTAPALEKRLWYPTRGLNWRPASVGAEGPLEALLPFMPDRILKPDIDSKTFLQYHCDPTRKRLGMELSKMKDTVPFLFQSRMVLMRVESKQWATKCLDNWMYHQAVEAGMPDVFDWKEIAINTGATLRGCGYVNKKIEAGVRRGDE